MDRVILHCDCNSFFASVETALDPSLLDVPMAVCGSVEARHGIILAKNELAKKYGIKTAQTVASAKRACPGLVLVAPHYDKYVEYSRAVNAIYSDYTDKIESFGIDESWLDVTASLRLFGSGVKIADEIRRRVSEEVGITVSVGVSFNKVFAKLGSDYKKPNATTVIDRSNFESLVFPLPVSDLLFVGKRTLEELMMIGVRTIGDLAHAPDSLIARKFGKSGEMLLKYARGEDDDPVVPLRDDSKSIGNGFTFKRDLTSEDQILSGVSFLSEEIARRLRDAGVLASTLSVSLKDENLSLHNKQKPLDLPTDIAKELSLTAMQIIRMIWSAGKPIRAITLTATNLVSSSNSTLQLDMFGDVDTVDRDRTRRGERAVDEIRRRFGSSAIVRGSNVGSDIGLYDPKTSKNH